MICCWTENIKHPKIKFSMSHLSLFSRLGLFVAREFLDQQSCKTIRLEMNRGVKSRAEILKGESAGIIDEGFRKTTVVEVSKNQVSYISERLRMLMPQLASHFQVPISMMEEPQFLRYQKGFFYRPHFDGSGKESHLEVDRRLISVVIFLNSQSDIHTTETFAGGSLAFYGLINDNGWRDYGFPLNGEEGLLVAFRADTVHEVTPILRGKRYTIAAWYR